MPVAVTITNASPAVITWGGSAFFGPNQPVVFNSTGTLPTGLTAGTIYYVVGGTVVGNSFSVSATPGGASINTSSAGSGTFGGQTGSDSNNGTTQTAQGAFISPQGAINYVLANVDLNGHRLTLQCAGAGGGVPSIYTTAVNMYTPFIGGDPTNPFPDVTLAGDTTTPSNALFSISNNQTCIGVFNPGSFLGVQGFKFTNSNSGGSALLGDSLGIVWITGTVEFGATSFASNGGHCITRTGGQIIVGAITYNVSGGGAAHWQATANGYIEVAGTTVSITASSSFNIWGYSDTAGNMAVTGLTVTGSSLVTGGQRYLAQNIAGIFTGTGNTSLFPGTTAGSPASANALSSANGGIYT